MKRNKTIVALAVFSLATALVFAGGPKRKVLIDGASAPPPYADSEVLVKFKESVGRIDVTDIAANQGLVVKKRFDLLSSMKGQQIVLLKSKVKIDAQVLAKKLAADPRVVYAHPNYRRELAATPNDPKYSSLWGMHNTGQTGGTNDADIDAPEAWEFSTGSSNVIVAVIDTGLDYNHSDLADNCWKNPGEIADNSIDDDANGYVDDIYGIDPAGVDGSGSSGDSDPMDGYGHGTHCAGTIGARGNNALGVVGVNWDVKIMGLKFFDDSGGNGYDAFSIECIQYAVYQKTHGQNVVAINASWGGYLDTTVEPIDALRDAIEISTNVGIVFCAAAGNGDGDADPEGDDNDSEIHHYPSDYTLPGIISVAATDHNDDLGSFSNYGATSVDLGAPGVSILSSVPRAYLPHEGDVFFDDMEQGEGKWVTSGTNNSWAITDEYEIYWGGDYPSCPSPTHFWSDRPGVGGNYTFYLSNTNSFLTYNEDIDLSSYTEQDVYLGLTMGRHIGRNDHVYVEISGNSGGSWYRLQDWGNTSGSIYFWASFSWAIPEAYKTANFRMRINLVSNTNDNGIGVVFDNIGIVTSLTSPYESWNGTSMATPHVAGAVAYLASIFPGETVAQRKERILYGGDDIPSLHTTTYSGNRLNLNGAYAYTPASDPSVTVTSPNGGEVWMMGSNQNITWSTTGTVGNVDIYYSTNSGAAWTSIVTNTPNDGTHAWTVPTITASTNCLVRVWENGDHEPADTSDLVFSIIANTTETITTPTTPTGTTSGMVGTTYTYTTGGSTSSMGHSVQYQFDWGDGTYSVWLPVGTTSASHSWVAPGTYNVRAMARCSTHYVQSAWSAALAVDLGDTPTFAAVSRFGALPGEPLPTVEWHTASEMGVAGFRLFRQDNRTREFLTVSASFLPALADSPQGGIYTLADPGAFAGEPQTYRLDEMNAQGQARSYGPFIVDFGTWAPEAVDPGLRLGKEEETGIEGFRRYRRERSSYELERLESRSRAAQAGAAQAVSAGGLARLTVKGKGIFYVQAGQVARALGIDEASARLAIVGYGLKLTGLGREIAWLADDGGAGLYFYNTGVETVYSDRNVYFLEPGSGLRMLGVSLPGAVAVDAQSFADALHFEENRYPLLISALDPAGDIWFWDWVSGGESKDFAVHVPAPAAGQATLAVSLQGATDTPAEEDHHAVVSVNGRQVGEARWNGTEAQRLEVSFDASLLQDGGNTVTIAGLLDTGAAYSVFYVESFDLSYPRYYRALENRLACRGDGNRVITVGGLTETRVLVLDVSRPERPLRIDAGTVDVLGRVSFVPADAAKEYAICGLNSALRPLAVAMARPAKIPEGQAFAHAVIAPREFKKAAGELAAYRSQQGLKSVLVLLEDIYDAYSHGVADPMAIRSFLAQFVGNGLKYAVLAGKGTYDYNDYTGYGDNLVPALLGKTPEGLCASDRIYGDLKGRNLVPEVAVGRLPAATEPELRAMIDKIKAYEAGQGAWLERGLWIADNADSGGDFATGSDELAALAAGTQAEKAYLEGSAADERAQIAAAWNAGLGLVSYCGHAGINQLATENLLDVPGALALANGEQLPLAVMLTCAAGRFELPGFMSLGEALLANAGGGMAGGMLPSGAAYHSDSMRLAEQWYKAVFQAKAARAGDAWLAALENYVLLGGKVSLLNVYNWLGDPGMLLK